MSRFDMALIVLLVTHKIQVEISSSWSLPFNLDNDFKHGDWAKVQWAFSLEETGGRATAVATFMQCVVGTFTVSGMTGCFIPNQFMCLHQEAYNISALKIKSFLVTPCRLHVRNRNSACNDNSWFGSFDIGFIPVYSSPDWINPPDMELWCF